MPDELTMIAFNFFILCFYADVYDQATGPGMHLHPTFSNSLPFKTRDSMYSDMICKAENNIHLDIF